MTWLRRCNILAGVAPFAVCGYIAPFYAYSLFVLTVSGGPWMRAHTEPAAVLSPTTPTNTPKLVCYTGVLLAVLAFAFTRSCGRALHAHIDMHHLDMHTSTDMPTPPRTRT